MKTVSKSLRIKIEEINIMLSTVNKADELPISYFGGTYPCYIQLTQPIEIKKDKYVYIHTAKGQNNFDGGRYLVKDEDQLDELKYDLRYIRQALKTTIK